MAKRAPFLSTLTAAAALAAVLVPLGNAQRTVLPTLYVAYTMNCTFAITDDSGKRVTSIAPGAYQVYITTPEVFGAVDLTGTFDMTACKSYVQFKLTGPGVSLNTTLQDGDEDKEMLPATFQPSSTYTALDSNQPSVARATFTTTATGSPSSPTGPGSPGTGTSGTKGSTQKQLVGSAVVPFRGKLAATVDAAGKLALTTKGKPVATLKSGLYTFTTVDKSAKTGFAIQKLKSSATTLTGVAYKGTHVASINLKPGQWTFFSPGGKKNYFIVAS